MRWHHVWQTVQLAKQTFMHTGLLRRKVTIMVDMMRTIVTIRRCGTAFRLRVVVESYGEHHWQIHQHQQPCKPHSSVVNMTHYPKPLLLLVISMSLERRKLMLLSVDKGSTFPNTIIKHLMKIITI